jgi:hypothetical protein
MLLLGTCTLLLKTWKVWVPVAVVFWLLSLFGAH